MEVLRIVGGTPLHGSVAASGAKNAALPIMAATLLADGPVRLANVPKVGDVATLIRVLAELGMEASWEARHQLVLRAVDVTQTRASRRHVRRMRASFCVLGPLLARRRRAIVPLPGGCSIGSRPIDLHLRGLAALGADLRITRGRVLARAPRLRGARIDLCGPRGPSVTGTANILCAAVLAAGETRIESAAREPEIVDLGWFLIRLGARINGLGTDTIRVQGVDQLGGCSYRIISDRIETATLLIAAAMTSGHVTVTCAQADHLAAPLESLAAAGCQIELGPDSISLSRPGSLEALRLVARPYPGLPTDLQPHFMAMASMTRGDSQIRDEVFPERLGHVAPLARMGANISGSIVPRPGMLIHGANELCGARVRAPDLRAGAALVLAALAARGTSVVGGVRHIDRGYERLDQKLARLGANIQRIGLERDSRSFPAGGLESEPTRLLRFDSASTIAR